MRTQETKIYKFEELNEEAQKYAIKKQMETHYQDDYLNEMITDCIKYKAVTDYCLPIDELKIEFSLSYCQGDGVAFYGKLDSQTMINIIRNSKDDDNCTLEESHISLLDKFGDISLDISRNSLGYHYSHYNTMNVFLCYDDMEFSDYELLENLKKFTNEIESFFQELIKRISKEMEQIGYDTIEDYCSEESCKDAIISNEYEFLACGKMV